MMTVTLRSSVVVFALILLLCSCGEPAPPKRPPSVPSAAVWAGGPDGGSWILCEVDLARNVNRCSVYNENTGELETSGDFVLRGENRAARGSELIYEWFDGTDIGLSGNRVLQPTTPPAATASQ